MVTTEELISLLALKLVCDDKISVRWATEAEVFILFTEVMACNPEVILECGTANGWTAAWMSLALKELKSNTLIHTFDIIIREHIMKLDNVRYYIEPFHIGGSRIVKQFTEQRKLIFIDGDHHKVSTKRDFDAVAPYLRKDDVVLFHDSIGEHGTRMCMHKLE